MKPFFKTGLRLAAAGLFAATATAADTDLAFTIEIKGSNNVPRLIITNNSPVLEFTKFTLTIGDFSKNFDGNTNSPVAPPGGTAVQALPIVVGPTNFRSDIAVVTLTGFGPGKSFSLDLDVDDDDPPVDTFEDYHTVFFNNGNLPNATITLESGPQSVSFTLSDRTSSQPTIWKAPLLNLKVRSVAETGGTDYVSKVLVKVDDGILPQYELATDVGELRTLGVPVGSQV